MRLGQWRGRTAGYAWGLVCVVLAAGGLLYWQALRPQPVPRYAQGPGGTPAGGDLRRTHRSPYTGPQSATLDWKFRSTGQGDSYGATLSAEDGTVYATAGSRLFALTLDGAERWLCPLPAAPGKPVLGDDGMLYVLCGQRTLLAVTHSGQVSWRVELPAPSLTDIAVNQDGRVFVGCSGGVVYAVDAPGRIAWGYGSPRLHSCIPQPGKEGDIYILDEESFVSRVNQQGRLVSKRKLGSETVLGLARLDDGSYITYVQSGVAKFRADGTQAWLFPLRGGSTRGGLDVRRSGEVLICFEDLVYALSAQGRKLWQYQAAGPLTGVPALAEDGSCAVIVELPENASGKRHAVLYLDKDGKLRWEYTLAGQMDYSAQATCGIRGQVYVSAGGAFIALDAAGAAAWTHTAGGKFASSPVLAADGTVYASSTDSRLYAIQPDGALKWQADCEGFVQAGPALLSDGTLLLTVGKTLQALHPDGSRAWRFDAKSPLNATPAVGPTGLIYVGDGDGRLRALTPDGLQVWAYRTSGDIASCSPAVGPNGRLYIGASYRADLTELRSSSPEQLASNEDDRLYAVKPNGRLAWSYKAGGVIWGGPAIGADGTLYFGSAIGTYMMSDDPSATPPAPCQLYALTPRGRKKWSFPVAGIIQSSPALGPGGEIYVSSWADARLGGDGSGHLYALSPDGKLLWDTPYGCLGTPCVGADGLLYSVGADHKLYAVTPAGQVRWSYELGQLVAGSPVIAPDGTLYVGCSDGYVYAFSDR